MDKAQFVYVIYINASQERVWKGLLDPELTRRYWWHDNVSDWRSGSRWEHRRSDGSGTIDIVGTVVESDQPRRIVLTWSAPADAEDPAKVSRVTFDLSPEDWPGGPWTRLQVTHGDLEPDSKMLHSVSYGWPGVCSGLKTLLEVGSIGAERAKGA